MNQRLAVPFLAVLSLVSPAICETIDEHGVIRDRVDSIERLRVTIPGKLLDFTLQNTGDGDRTIWFLVEPFPEEAEKEEDQDGILPACPAGEGNRASLDLFRLDRETDGPLVKVRSDLPWKTDTLTAADLDLTGQDELLIRVEGDDGPGLYAWNGDPASGDSMLVSILAGRFLVWDRQDPGIAAVQGMGNLAFHRYDSAQARFDMKNELPVPMEASVTPDHIRLMAGTAQRIEMPAGSVVYAIPPMAFGKARLRTVLIRPDLEPDEQVVDSWSRLPAPEELMAWHYRVLDGEPVLIAQTRTTEKLALFGEKQIRVYGLRKDRSRSGFLPLLAAESGMNLWQDGTPWILDVNRDGRDDLVLGYWKGLKDDRVVLETYLRNQDGSFDDKAKTTAFDVKDGDRSYIGYGRDLNGDDLFDLVVSADDRLLLFPGLPTGNGKHLVDGDPITLIEMEGLGSDEENSVTVAVGTDGSTVVLDGGWAGTPQFLDIDGDGGMEIVFVRHGSDKIPGTFTALFLQ